MFHRGSETYSLIVSQSRNKQLGNEELGTMLEVSKRFKNRALNPILQCSENHYEFEGTGRAHVYGKS